MKVNTGLFRKVINQLPPIAQNDEVHPSPSLLLALPHPPTQLAFGEERAHPELDAQGGVAGRRRRRNLLCDSAVIFQNHHDLLTHAILFSLPRFSS